MQKWFEKRGTIYWYDQYANNEQASAFSKYDPDRIAKELIKTGVDIIAVYAANQWGIAYYPSKIWPQHPNLKGRDYVGDLVSRLRSRGKRVVLYVNWLDSKNAEWNMIPIDRRNDPYFTEQPLASWAKPGRPNGRVQNLPGGQWRFPCLNSPHRDQVVAVTREICERYRPDAFHLDMGFNPDICVCKFCRAALEKICGAKEITRKAVEEHWTEFIDWRCKVSGALFAQVTAVLKEYGVVAAHNAFSPLFKPAMAGLGEDWLASLDVYVSECFDAFLRPGTDLNASSVNVRLQHALRKPSWILRTSTQQHYAHWPISEAQWQISAAACKANGSKVFGPCGAGAYPDTTTSQKLLKRVKGAFDFYMQDADLAEGAVSAARVAIVFSWATRKYFEPGINPLQWLEELNGWSRLLMEEHVPFDLVVAENVREASDFSKYDLVILPNTANVSGIFCNAVRAYVKAGGRILATAESSLRDEKGGKRRDYCLADVMGVEHRGSFEGHFAIESKEEPEPASGIFQKVFSSGKVIAYMVGVDPAGSVAAMKDPLPMEQTDSPVIIENKFGKGKAMYICFDIGRFFTIHGDEHIGERMIRCVDRILPKRQIYVKAPRTVEVTAWKQGHLNRTIIHLANRTVAWSLPTDSRQITEVIPVHDIELKMKKPSGKPKISCRGAKVKMQVQGKTLCITVPRLDAYAAVVIE